MGVWQRLTFKQLIRQIQIRVIKKFDCIIFIEGETGSGKSSLAYKIADGLNIEHYPVSEQKGYHLNPDGSDRVFSLFKPKRDIIFTREDLIKHYATKNNSIILADELINVAFLRDFYQEEQKNLIKILNMYRDSYNIFIGCVPLFAQLDKQIQNRCAIKITIKSRGFALVHLPLDSNFKPDKWDTRTNEKIENTWTNKGGLRPRYSQLTTLAGFLIFADLTPNLRREYELIKTEKRSRITKEYKDDTLTYDDNKFYSNLITSLKNGIYNHDSFETIMKDLGRDPEKVRTKINQMLKEQNDTKRWRDYCHSKDKKIKRDLLGFKVEDKESNVGETPVIETFEPISEHHGGEEEGDVFGF